MGSLLDSRGVLSLLPLFPPVLGGPEGVVCSGTLEIRRTMVKKEKGLDTDVLRNSVRNTCARFHLKN